MESILGSVIISHIICMCIWRGDTCLKSGDRQSLLTNYLGLEDLAQSSGRSMRALTFCLRLVAD